MTAYYNEIDPAAVHVLRELIAGGFIAPGHVDDRSIKDVTADDIRGYTQCHFFAGMGGWSIAARMAGWPDNEPIWSASCPCQPFSAAGKGLGTDDPRHLWPDLFRLVSAIRPGRIVGEQVSGAPGYGWLDGIRADLETEGYASEAIDIPACAVDAPHIRQRLYWVAVANSDSTRSLPASQPGIHRQAQSERPRHGEPERLSGAVAVGDAFGAGLEGQRGHGDAGGRQVAARPVAQTDDGLVYADTDGRRRDGRQKTPEWGASIGTAAERDNAWRELGDADSPRELERQRPTERVQPIGGGRHLHTDGRNGSFYADAEWIICHDGKARRAKPGIRLLVDGMAGRIDLWRLAGNGIVLPLAAEAIAALKDILAIQSMQEAA